MSLPSTPISECPLQQLTIRDGEIAKQYHSSPPDRVFSLSLEGDRSPNSKPGTLILLVFHGKRQVISIRLNDPFKNSPAPNGLVSIDRPSYRLHLQMPGGARAVQARFEEARDFNMAVAMLAKNHIYINNSISDFRIVAVSGESAATSLSPQPAQYFGPRAFSVSPSPRPEYYTSEAIGDLSTYHYPPPPRETSLPTSPWIGGDPASRHRNPQTPQRMNSLPCYPAPSTHTSFGVAGPPAGFNPYDLFTRSSSDTHKPRVGSPLRRLYYPLHPSIQPARHVSFTEPQHSLCDARNTDSSVTGPPLHQVIPTANAIFYSQQSSSSNSEMESPELRMANGQGETPSPPGATQHFRELMPRPRELPFDAQRKRMSQKIKTKMGPEADPETATQKKHASRLQSGKDVEEDLATRSSVAESKRKQSTASAHPASHAGGLANAACNLAPSEIQVEKPSLSPGEAQTEKPSRRSLDLPMVLVADPEMLSPVFDATSRLLDQYEADVTNGSDEKASARFYMDLIHETRKQFWAKKLMEIKDIHVSADV